MENWMRILLVAFAVDLLFAGEFLVVFLMEMLPPVLKVAGAITILFALVQFAIASVLIKEKAVVRVGVVIAMIFAVLMAVQTFLPGVTAAGFLVSIANAILPAYLIGAIMYAAGLTPKFFDKKLPFLNY